MHNLLLANSVEYYDERVAPWSFSLNRRFNEYVFFKTPSAN